MLLTSIYLLVVLRYKVEAKNMIKAFIIGMSYIIVINIGNKIFGTNYIMMTSLPDNVLGLYPFLVHITPIIPLIFVGVLAFLFSYFPAYYISKLDNRDNIETISELEEHKEKIA